MVTLPIKTLYNLPDKYRDAYLSAWKEKFHGVTLSWIDIEICRLATSTWKISDLYEFLSERYELISNTPKSSFYRNIDSLIENGYLSGVKQGRSKIISATENGIKELGRLGRYMFEIQMTHTILQTWSDVLDVAMKYVISPLSKKIAFIIPDYSILGHIVHDLIKKDGTIELSETDFKNTINDTYIPGNVYYINFGKNITNKTSGITILNSSINDFPLKDNFIDLIFEHSGITSFNDSEYIKELYRILKPNGYLIAVETTKTSSKMATRIMQEISYLMNLSNEYEPWNFSGEFLEMKELSEKISKFKFKLREGITDIATSIFVYQKVE